MRPAMLRRPARPSAAFRSGVAVARTILAAAILVAVTMVNSQVARADHCKLINCHSTTGDCVSQPFFTVEVREGRVASAARQQSVAAGRVPSLTWR